ncbi:MAG: hypothetical protein EOP50_00040 [Sphingobacteriales bacterium]|nr:MAG: hypothetical protein EOP50_00040 [Sphingobacteriales bacterium]
MKINVVAACRQAQACLRQICLAVLLVLAALWTGKAYAASNQATIVDTDMAFDDWLAVYLVAKQANVTAVTISAAGETYCEAGRKNAQYLLALAGKTHIPIACGPSEPQNGYNAFPTAWRIQASEMAGRNKRHQDIKLQPASTATALLNTAISKSRGKVRILALGPLTNIANLLSDSPKLRSKIESIYIMGGAVSVPGNIRVPGFTDASKNNKSEWNFYVDPAAAATVMTANVARILVPLDATQFAPVNTQFLDALGSISTPAAIFFRAAYSSLRSEVEAGHLYFWDSAAAMCMLQPSLCKLSVESLSVVQEFKDAQCPLKTQRCDYVEASAGAIQIDPLAQPTTYASSLASQQLKKAVLEILAK